MSLHGFNETVPGDGRYPCGKCAQCAKRSYATCTRPVASKSYRDYLLAPRPDPVVAAHDAEIAALLTKVRNSYADVVQV
jgi:threonine dehydrogenase-like Zn-dependent dehydrogenase